jgi:hypothetical protein
MSDAAACYGCGARLPRALLETVGDTVFCRECLTQMLRRGDERRARAGAVPGGNQVRGSTGAHQDVGAADPGPMKAAAADAPCFVCGGALDGPTLFELRGFAICGGCARGLIGEGAAPDDAPALERARAAVTGDVEETLDVEIEGAIESAIDDATDGAAHAAHAAPRSVLPEGSSRVVVTPGSGTEWCSRCGRAMPGPGSYQLVEGRPTCPACVAAHAQRTARAASFASAASPEADDACDCDARGVCEACSRPIDPAVRETQGFRLCAACLHSDPELALAIARSRHQLRLARAGRRLLEGEDD